jgi:hypothetical protein
MSIHEIKHIYNEDNLLILQRLEPLWIDSRAMKNW